MAASGSETIQRELEKVKAKLKNVEGIELVACVPAMVRIHITKTEHKNLAVCFMFPDNYPQEPIVMELKSKVLSDRLLEGLTKVCDEHAKTLVGQQQILLMVEFISKFISDNPLCVCSEEINFIKKNLIDEGDAMKLKQKTSQIILKIKQAKYLCNITLTIPDDYPTTQLSIEITHHNLPELLKVNTLAQAVEISRQCVTPPIRKKPKDPPFEPKPALKPVADFFIAQCLKRFPSERCPCCKEIALPDDPKAVIQAPTHPRFVERVYCGHLFHHSCLDKYMKTPPFTGGKKCPTCGNRIYHEKWKAAPELAEARWAHQEAKKRELAEVVDFLE